MTFPTADLRKPARRPYTFGFWVAVQTAVVAGMYSIAVVALLLASYTRRQAKDPLQSPEFLAARDQLVQLSQQPGGEELDRQIEALKQDVRDWDFRLRSQYYLRRHFTEIGTYLLLGGIVVFLVSVHTAATLRRELPAPGPYAPPEDKDARVRRVGSILVGVVTALLAGTTLALWIGVRTRLPETDRALAALLTPPRNDGQAGGDGLPTNGSHPLAAPDYPTPDVVAEQWPRFRGPGGSGISAYANVPTSWNGASGEGILWKQAVPLPGNGSPVVWQRRVFLSGATKERREVYCFDADTGKLLWRGDVPATPQSRSGRTKTGDNTGYAASTPATDGRRVYAMFANGDVAAFDFSGKRVWVRGLGVPDSSYGYAASLATYRDRLIVQFDQASAKDDKSRLYALTGVTGRTAWEAVRQVPNSWASPIVAEHGGRAMIVASGDPWVIAYDAADGSEIWRAKCLRQDVGPSPVFAEGVVYVVSEFPALSAIRADGEGDVTKTHVLWQAEYGLPDTASPLVTGELVLLLASYGTLTCYDAAKGGEPLWEEDFDGNFSSSPSLAGKLVYLFDEDGKTWIVEPTRDKCKHVAEAELGEACVTSPAFQDGRIYIRGKEHLFCIGGPPVK